MILKVPAGVRVFLGAPAEPMDQALVASISDTVALVPDILEAHLPQCYIPQTMRDPAKVLVVIVPAFSFIEPIVTDLGNRLSRLLPRGIHLDVWPLTDNSSLLSAVRGAGCKIFDRSSTMKP